MPASHPKGGTTIHCDLGSQAERFLSAHAGAESVEDRKWHPLHQTRALTTPSPIKAGGIRKCLWKQKNL
jgi:hypothetical protein